jgi:hypothetical protein
MKYNKIDKTPGLPTNKQKEDPSLQIEEEDKKKNPYKQTKGRPVLSNRRRGIRKSEREECSTSPEHLNSL